MPSLPPTIVPLLTPFASLFDARTWRKVPILLAGVILAPGRRTVSTALYVLGLHERGDFARFHHILSRASWSPLAVSRVLLEQLVRHLVPTGPLLFAIDETLERRWGEKIEALGVYLDRGISWTNQAVIPVLPAGAGRFGGRTRPPNRQTPALGPRFRVGARASGRHPGRGGRAAGSAASEGDGGLWNGCGVRPRGATGSAGRRCGRGPASG